jgi:monomeric isocitrate dehydrogenase
MNPRLKSLVWGILIGAFVAMLITLNVPHKDLPPPVDLKPFQDTIDAAIREKHLAAARAIYWMDRAQNAEKILEQNKKKRHADIQVIETATPDLLDRWNDSVLTSAGLR